MQLAELAHQKTWYFMFGSENKSSLAAQYALEHALPHLVNPTQEDLRPLTQKILVIEGSAALFREVETWKVEITGVFLPGQLSAEENAIRDDYKAVGRVKEISEATYSALRRELYPKVVIIYGPKPKQNFDIANAYFAASGFTVIKNQITANDLITKLPKTNNYLLLNLLPTPQELEVLEAYCHLKVVHIKYKRVQIAKQKEFWTHQTELLPNLSKKDYFRSVLGNRGFLQEILADVGQAVCPELIFVDAEDEQERAGVQRYVAETNGLLISSKKIEEVIKRKPVPAFTEQIRLQAITHIIFRNMTRSQIFLIDSPSNPAEFVQLEQRTRPIRLFADCRKIENFKPVPAITSTVYFLQTLRRRKIDLDLPFGGQIQDHKKYLLVSGAPCSGKTSAAKYISSQLGYKHIEYEPYLASIKQKLAGPDDGEELPFKKVIEHFRGLIESSGDTPLVIDGLTLECKDIEAWVKSNGPPTILNLKLEEKDLITRTRKKNEADLAAEVSEEETAKAKQCIQKNSEWTDQFVTKSPLSLLYQIDFSVPLILGESLLAQVLRPRVYLIQDSFSLVYQNLAIQEGMGYFSLARWKISDVAQQVKQGNYRDVILGNYAQNQDQMICEDFYNIEKNIGTIRYLSVWDEQEVQVNDQLIRLEKPPEPEKPKPAEGEEEGEAPPEPDGGEEQGEIKKKAINIYDYEWTQPGNRKNLSQWFHKQKSNISQQTHSAQGLLEGGFKEVVASLKEKKALAVYDRIEG